MCGEIESAIGSVCHFLAGVFDTEDLHILNSGHRNGLSSCRLGCNPPPPPFGKEIPTIR